MFAGERARAFRALAERCLLHRFGGDCYNYAMLAAGYLDLVVESQLKPYDIVPLIPILEGAGCVVTDWQGRPPLAGGDVVAAGEPRAARGRARAAARLSVARCEPVRARRAAGARRYAWCSSVHTRLTEYGPSARQGRRTSRAGAAEPGPTEPAGRVEVDSRGNSVWRWARDVIESTSVLLKRLENKDLALEPTQKVPIVRGAEAAPKGRTGCKAARVQARQRKPDARSRRRQRRESSGPAAESRTGGGGFDPYNSR